MSVRGPPPGDYYIVNSLSTPDGTQLALTNNGERAFLTVTEFNKGTYAPAQVWNLERYQGDLILLNVAPQSDTGLKVVLTGAGNLTVYRTSDNPWYITGTGLGDVPYQIGGGGTAHWGVKEGAVGQVITFLDAGRNPNVEWKLIPAYG